MPSSTTARRFHFAVIVFGLLAGVALLRAQTPGASQFGDMQWRQIGPTRAGRARALSGVPTEPNLFYVGFDDGGVWRTDDYGSTWSPIFDAESTGSIGAIAVAPSNPNVIYVGTGAGIIRPDLATGDGVYKSVDAGKTWTHLADLRDTEMIANIEVDPQNPDRLFVAALGHPYGPNEQRGVYRSTDGGQTFQRVLYKDEYTSANDVRIDPKDPNTVYAGLWQQQQGFYENGSYTGTSGGLFKSTDGGNTWQQLTNGLPQVIEVNLAIAPSNPDVVYAAVASQGAGGGGGRGGRGGGGAVEIFRSNDAGAHWTRATEDTRPTARIGGGDLPTLTVDPDNANVVYSCTPVLWRSEDGGATWSAVRGAPGGDDYQKVWVNPTNHNILLVVSDQGPVISVNYGVSWSNWYTIPTAAIYHVGTDDAFPYRACGGQQDSGSVCVKSRGNDGEITFHDWHPVGIEEYGAAAPDPKNPDLVYGGKVTVYNREDGQIANVGPAGGRGAAAAAGSIPYRTVRTQPLVWSPVNDNILFFASNTVWKTLDGGHNWTRISPDLTRSSWQVPASAGKYADEASSLPAEGATPNRGTITALAPSPVDVNVLWAGTDDGNIQVTRDGGLHWTNVTPPQIKAWTRIFNMDAGSDVQTAYAAANTMRIDDMNPHFYRTHDGGKTWTEIDNGMAPGAVANSIRQDPKQKNVLYAATETQCYVSFDDGDHWTSLRLNMPAVSVRDIQVKGDDLVAGTHGRGFWILDDLTPLRQAAAAAAAGHPYLYKPETAIRVRFDMDPPTPWPPELPAGQNPPDGAILDYYLPSAANGAVTLEILDGQGRLVRRYASTDHVEEINPATYNEPLYWPAPPQVVSTAAGEHRFLWDMHYEPLPSAGGGGRGGGGGGGGCGAGAVPYRTAPCPNAPWAPPGTYTARLIVDGNTYSQTFALTMDPRVKTPAVALQQIYSYSTDLYFDAVKANTAHTQLEALRSELEQRQLSGAAAEAAATWTKAADALAPPAPAGGGGFGGRGGRGGRGGGAAGPPTLSNLASSLIAAASPLQASEMTPTAETLAGCSRATAEYTAVMARWNELRGPQLATLNAALRAANQPPLTLPAETAGTP